MASLVCKMWQYVSKFNCTNSVSWIYTQTRLHQDTTYLHGVILCEIQSYRKIKLHKCPRFIFDVRCTQTRLHQDTTYLHWDLTCAKYNVIAKFSLMYDVHKPDCTKVRHICPEPLLCEIQRYWKIKLHKGHFYILDVQCTQVRLHQDTTYLHWASLVRDTVLLRNSHWCTMYTSQIAPRYDIFALSIYDVIAKLISIKVTSSRS